MPVILRTLTLTKEEAALVRVALVTLRERPGVLSREGRALMPALEAKAQATIDSFPKEVRS
jgi:hypothetical protein